MARGTRQRMWTFDDYVKEYETLLAKNSGLKEELKLLHALQAAGVDNWVGYEIALESLD